MNRWLWYFIPSDYIFTLIVSGSVKLCFVTVSLWVTISSYSFRHFADFSTRWRRQESFNLWNFCSVYLFSLCNTAVIRSKKDAIDCKSIGIERHHGIVDWKNWYWGISRNWRLHRSIFLSLPFKITKSNELMMTIPDLENKTRKSCRLCGLDSW